VISFSNEDRLACSKQVIQPQALLQFCCKAPFASVFADSAKTSSQIVLCNGTLTLTSTFTLTSPSPSPPVLLKVGIIASVTTT
jgi:hypothetical protein